MTNEQHAAAQGGGARLRRLEADAHVDLVVVPKAFLRSIPTLTVGPGGRLWS